MPTSKKIMIVVCVAFAVIAVFGCVALAGRNQTPAAPTQQLEQEDCDKEDIKNKDVADCGVGVLIPTTKKTPTKPVVIPPKPRNTRR